MARFITTGLLLLVCALSLISAHAKPLDASIDTSAVLKDDPLLFDASQIKAGLRGHGYTVFSSRDGVAEFQFEVLGILTDYLGPRRNIIVVRLESKALEGSTVVAGMSGSPVYIDGKLVGAVAYGFVNHSKDTIAGITPIGDMLKMEQSFSTGLGLKKLSMPLSVSGLDEKVAKHFTARLKERGYGAFFPAASLGASPKDSGKKRLRAADPVAAVLVSGDMLVGAIGTTTWIKGDRFLAFGHPFLSTGTSDVPVANAEIVTTLFSQENAHKLGQPRALIGGMTEDRAAGIAGRQGEVPKMIEFKVSIDGQDFHYKVARLPTDSPTFLALAFANALQKREGVELGGTYSFVATLKFANHGNLTIARKFAGDGIALELGLADILQGELSQFLDQPLLKVVLEKIDIDVSWQAKVDRAKIIEVFADGRFERGKSARFRSILKPWRQPTKSVVVESVLPAGLSAGEYDLVVTDRSGAIELENTSGLQNTPNGFSELLEAYRKLPSDNELCIYMLARRAGKLVSGIPMPDAKSTLAGVFENHWVDPAMQFGRTAVKLACQPVDAAVVVGQVSGVADVQ